MPYTFDSQSDRYRDTATGRYVTRSTALEYVERSIGASSDVVTGFAHAVANGDVSAADWHSRMREEIKGEYIRQYLLGRGGLGSMTADDYGSIGGMIADQYRYLDGFYEQVRSGELGEAQIAARAKMYIRSAREGYERGHSRAVGMPFGALPAYPGDGSTECLSNCACFWEFETERNSSGQVSQWNAYWRLGATEAHCTTCPDRAAMWQPFVLVP